MKQFPPLFLSRPSTDLGYEFIIYVCFSRDMLFVVLEGDLSWLLWALVGTVRQDLTSQARALRPWVAQVVAHKKCGQEKSPQMAERMLRDKLSVLPNL